MPEPLSQNDRSDELVYSVDLTDHEIQALLDACYEARTLVKGFKPDVRAKYEATPMWSACRTLEIALYGRTGCLI
jgi:hypothetical protein